LIRRVYAYVAYRIGDGPAAEDVTSRVFERAIRYRSSYDRSKGSALAWMIGIANRCIADAAPSDSLSFEQAGERADPADLEADTLRRIDLREAVAALDERSRTLIALRYGADLTARQIADIVELSPHAVEVALARALAHLERRMAPADERRHESAAQSASP
jgi:RNA polymerase sigma factor (sigma-70 family)